MRRGIIQGKNPVNHGKSFHVKSIYRTGSNPNTILRNLIGGSSSNFTSGFTFFNGRLYINRTDNINGINFLVSNGNPSGLLNNPTLTIFSSVFSNSYNSSHIVVRDRTSANSGTGILYPFKDGSNLWGFIRKPSTSTFEYINQNIGTYSQISKIILNYDSSNNSYNLSYNNIKVTGTNTTQDSGNTVIPDQFDLCRNNLFLREVIYYSRLLTASEIDVLEKYQKYDTGT
jgi:hypothetical protein